LRARLGRGAAWVAAFLLGSTEASTMDVSLYWNFSDPAASEAAFRRALSTAADGDDALVLQTQIARTYSLRARFEDAHALLDRLEPQLASAGAEPRVRLLLERGRTFRSARVPERARPLFAEAAERAQAAGLDALQIDALHMIALVEPGTDAQLEWNRRALVLARASSDPIAQRWEASLANNIGWTLADAGRYEQALASFETALAARERLGRTADIRSARWMIARTLRSLGRHDEALARLRDLERQGEAAGEPDGYVFEEIGENLLARHEDAAARPYFAKACQLLSADASLDRPDAERLDRLQRLGR
jgi:tetratricopeptide (TPR) repeat protein